MSRKYIFEAWRYSDHGSKNTCKKKKMCRISARRISIYNFAWGPQKVTKKVYVVSQK
jgi:hypothetical protein